MTDHPDQCGRIQNGPGHPRRGWLKLHVSGTKEPHAVLTGRWYCSPRCLMAALARVAHIDITGCAACINRHARGHRCPVCGSTPQVIPTRPTPTRGRLFDFPIPASPDPEDQPREDHPA